MRKLKMNLLAICSLVLIWSCGPKISSTVKTTKDLSSYETYAYLPNSDAEAPDKVEQSNEVGEQIVAAMNRNMQKAGYTIDREDPDLLVIINTNYDQESDVDVYRDYDYNYAYYPYTTSLPVNTYYNDYYYNGYTDYGPIYDYDVVMNQYTDSGMVVSLVDKDTKNIVWTGSVDDFYVYQDNASEEVAEYVDNIFSDYPTISQN
ncbi:DUF4136 domain-containing protein [Costertonia aggregata]|uniref:DUF4136 domain-containing protein n=1 Tax=Costertonia aggregata TaxID=343403 RepID=A0A7H9AT52_9FLAO|nr:DUF4136 domain-containing protein [Costertonia aggregata]QLG46522.1 DUF4136 domain-containing protein [Costertonia aggregata]